MSRTGPEPKPPWQAVPASVRQSVEQTLGAPVQRAVRVWGGYGPTPTFRLRLVDDRRAFLKGINPESNDFMRAAFGREVRVYRELGDIIANWAPALYGSFEIDGWSVILLEDLGPKSAPPWTPQLARRIAHACARFHAGTVGRPLPSWLPGTDEQSLGPERLWLRARQPGWLRGVASLAGDRSEDALGWFDRSIATLADASQGLVTAGHPLALLHGDTRSDNLRWVRGRLYLFDWPHVSVGHPEDDASAFAQTVTVEGGPDPETVMSWYGEVMPVRHEVLDAAVASLAGFFADVAWREELPGLPRVRGFQRRQLRTTLGWAATRLALPPPDWIDAIPD